MEIFGRLEDLDDAARIRIADEVFGGTGGEQFVQLLGQGEEALRGTMARAHEVGAVLDEEMISKAADLDRRFSDLAARAGNFFQTVIVSAADAAFALSRMTTEGGQILTLMERLDQLGIDTPAAVEALDTDAISAATAEGRRPGSRL